jgi:cytoskeletal protein CcmA (bactofilin family)
MRRVGELREIVTELSTSAPTSVNGGGEPAAAESPTTLAKNDILNGSLTMKGDGQILGGFQGEIDCTGELFVGREAEVVATVVTKNMTISGFLRGNVTANGRLKIMATGRLEGDARVGSLIVQEGGVYHGAIQVHPEGVPKAEDRAEHLDTLPLTGPQTPVDAGPGPVERVKKFWGEFF